MNRRSLLKRGLGLFAMPALITDALAEPRGELRRLSEAWAAAADASRPLLILVLPEDMGASWRRGHVFGEWLVHGPAEDLAMLSALTLVCARPQEVRRMLPTVLEDAWMVLAHPAGALGSPRFVRVAVEDLPDGFYRGRPEGAESWTREQRAAWEDEGIDRRIAGTSTAFRVLMEVPPGVSASLNSDTEDPTEGSTGDRAGDSARREILGVDPPGARWASSHGCGVRYIHAEDRGVAFGCGLGHVPARSSLFLSYYTGD